MPLVMPKRGPTMTIIRSGYVDSHKQRGFMNERTYVLPFPRSSCDAKCTHVSPLHEVLLHSPESVNIELIEVLLKSGAQVNAICKNNTWRSCNSETAFQMGLSVVINTDNLQLLRLFLQHGADPNMRMSTNIPALRSIARTAWRPIHMAVDNMRVECTKALLDAGAEVNTVRVQKKRNFRRLVEQDSEETPLHIACCAYGDVLRACGDTSRAFSMVKLLVERGANVNAVRRYLSGVLNVRETALHMAVKSKAADIVWMLISAGADSRIPFQVGDITHTVWELCEDTETHYALLHSWSPQTHGRHSSGARLAIKTLLLVAKRQNWDLSTLVMHNIFGFVAAGVWT